MEITYDHDITYILLYGAEAMNRKLKLISAMVLSSVAIGNAHAALTDDQGTVHFRGKLLIRPVKYQQIQRR